MSSLCDLWPRLFEVLKEIGSYLLLFANLLTTSFFPATLLFGGTFVLFSSGNDLIGTVKDPHVMTMTMTFMTMIKLKLLLLAMKLRVNQSETRRDGGQKCSPILAVKTIVRMNHSAVSYFLEHFLSLGASLMTDTLC